MAYNVLIADKDNESCDMMSQILCGDVSVVYSVYVTQNIEPIWKLMLIHQFDLVLISAEFIDYKGFNLIKRIKSKNRSIPIIVLTGEFNSELINNFLDSGASDYIRKPIEEIEFKARVKSNLMLREAMLEVQNKNRMIEAQIYDLDKLSLIVKQTDNSVILFTPEGQAEWANEGFHKMYGYTFDEFVEKYGSHLEGFSYNADVKTHFAKLLEKKKSVNYTTKCRVKYGAVKWIQTTLTPIFDGNRVEKVIAIESDVSAQKSVEFKLLKHGEETQKLMQSLKEANQKLEKQRSEILEQNRTIEIERNKADDLLLNILPTYVVSELKSMGYASPRSYKMATVMFTDFKGFTKSCENLSPEEIVDALDFFFSKFDDIISCHYIEKIKTIGDSYMCVGGIPLRNRSNPFDVVLAGLEIKHFMATYKQRFSNRNLPDWQLRIGIHTGSLVAGVVGKIKFAYDTWGDSVNVAKRMESADEIGSVNISSDTYEYIKDYFICRHRGPVEIKNHKNVDMYFVDRLKPEFSLDDEGIYPNDHFIELLNQI
ncbi:MAG: response regulator [Bacteroidales bacterium]|nr:response regulator [Bacteroidales bacterium]